MSAPIPPPSRPARTRCRRRGLAQLVEAYNARQYEVLVGRSAPANLDAVFAHALAALALLHTLVGRLQAARWSTIRTALAADAGWRRRSPRHAPWTQARWPPGSARGHPAGRRWADGAAREWGAVELMARSVRGER